MVSDAKSIATAVTTSFEFSAVARRYIEEASQKGHLPEAPNDFRWTSLKRRLRWTDKQMSEWFEGYQAVKEELEQRDRENASKSIVEDWDTIGENPNSPRPSTTALNSSIQKIPSQPFIGSEEITAHLGQVVHSQQRVRDRSVTRGAEKPNHTLTGYQPSSLPAQSVSIMMDRPSEVRFVTEAFESNGMAVPAISGMSWSAIADIFCTALDDRASERRQQEESRVCQRQNEHMKRRQRKADLASRNARAALAALSTMRNIGRTRSGRIYSRAWV